MNRSHIKTWLTVTISAVLLSSCTKLDLKPACFSPYVDFVAYNVDPSTLQVSFNSVTTFNGTITSYNWEFGDGTSYSGQTPPAHIYQALTSANPSKSYRIKLTVTNECGSSYWTKDITVGPCLANVKFAATTSNNIVTFTNQSSSSTATSYTWNFGDSTSITTSTTSFSHTYVNGGTYQVVLKATNSCGDNFYTLPVTVCNGVGTIDSLNYTSDDLTFISIGTASVTNATSYLWNFGDGTTSTLQNPGTKIYSTPAQYTWTLTVSNNCSSANTSLIITAPRLNNITDAPLTNFLAVAAVTSNTIYYVGSNGVFYRFDGNNLWTNLGSIPITVDANTRLIRDHLSNVWVYGTGGVARWTGTTWLTNSSLSLGYASGAIIKDVDFDNTNKMWSCSGTQIRSLTTLRVSTVSTVNSIAFASTTNTIWYTLAANSTLFGYSIASTSTLSRSVTNLSTNSINIEVDSLTNNLYISSNAGIVRCDPNGLFSAYFYSGNTSYLSTPPIKIQFDNRGFVWILESIGGDFIRMTKNASAPDAKLYSTVPNINNINDFSIELNSGTNDIFLAKYQANAAIRIF